MQPSTGEGTRSAGRACGSLWASDARLDGRRASIHQSSALSIRGPRWDSSGALQRKGEGRTPVRPAAPRPALELSGSVESSPRWPRRSVRPRRERAPCPRGFRAARRLRRSRGLCGEGSAIEMLPRSSVLFMFLVRYTHAARALNSFRSFIVRLI